MLMLMLKCEIIPYVQLKPTWLIVNLYAINKHDLQPNISTTDDIHTAEEHTSNKVSENYF